MADAGKQPVPTISLEDDNHCSHVVRAVRCIRIVFCFDADRQGFDLLKGVFMKKGLLVLLVAYLSIINVNLAQADNKVVEGVKTVGGDVKKGAEKVGEGAKKVGEVTVAGAKKVGEATVAGAKKVGEGAKKVGEVTVAGAKKVGEGAKKGVEAVGSGLKKGAETVVDKAKDLTPHKKESKSSK